MTENSLSGARESNAGDEFHILWAARQAVKLLNSRTGLKAVFVEKVAPADEDATEDDVFLGVDLSEYYGGTDFDTAATVIASQLKFSTRHPKKEWTASRLCAKKSKDAAPVIKRLADAVKGFSEKHGREKTLNKLRIRLVSNQPISVALAAALKSAKQILDAAGEITEMPANVLLKQLTGTGLKEIEKLYRAANLKSAAFTDFLRVLDFTKLGEESNAFQRIRLMQELSVSINYDPQANLKSLCDLIRYEARPEAEHSVGLTERDVLAAMGVGNRDALFPAPSRLQMPDDPIETKEPANLARVLLDSESKRVLAHGNAGVGKTTTILGLSKHLPEGSVVVVYDCYGGGDYLIAGDERHTPRRAFLQLTNELAATCGTPLLIKPSPDVADTVREFRRSLAAAEEAVAATDKAVLVVVVDAADNAVVAAQGTNDCFVFPLWNFPLPESCRLLVTSRSHRRASLNPPADVNEYELRGFDEDASAEHLRRYFAAATGEECRRFHIETAGNPRLQYYNLEKAQATDSIVSVGDFLLNAYRTPDEIFADLVEAAVAHAPEPEKARNFLSLMVTLKPPVPLAVFAAVCEIKPEEAENFCRALMPGIVLEENEFVFRDEDFETYVRRQVSDEQMLTAHSLLAEKFLALAPENDYAAREVAAHLFFSNKYAELINLVLGGSEPLAIKDEVVRLRISRERIGYALGAARHEARTGDIIKLLVIAAETARSNEAVLTLIRENPDLAAAYADPEEIGRFFLAEENQPWLGAAHLRTAVFFARKPELKEEALEHLRAAEAWFRRKRVLPDYESDHWETTELDIACGAEAVFWTLGAEAAKNWLKRWRPPEAIIKSLEILAASLVKQDCRDALEDFLRAQKIPVVARAVIVSAMYSGNVQISDEAAEKVFRHLSRFIRRKNYRNHLGDWAINVCELFAAREFDKAQTVALIDALCPSIPKSTPDGYGDMMRYDAPVRARCLKSALNGEDLTFEEILPEKLRPKEQKPAVAAAATATPPHYDSDSDSDRRKWREYLGKLLPVYKLRARTIIEKSCKIEDISAELRRSLKEQNTRSGDWRGSLNPALHGLDEHRLRRAS